MDLDRVAGYPYVLPMTTTETVLIAIAHGAYIAAAFSFLCKR